MKIQAIIGGGPRGLFALESLFLAINNSSQELALKVLLFEPFPYPGAGWVWSPDQVESNWLNITERGLQNLPARPEIRVQDQIIPEFPSYTDWLPLEDQNPPAQHPDQFPPRAKMGTYLNARYETIAKPLMGIERLEIIKEKVIDLNYPSSQFVLKTKSNTFDGIDEVVLTIGHQDTVLSEQLQSWKNHIVGKTKALLFTEPYPVETILKAPIKKDTVVAFRGFGLAMIDQIRALTLEKGGYFEMVDAATKKVVFHTSHKHPQQFVPFSLDGLPMVPKPLNAQIDYQYTPSGEVMDAFAKAIQLGAQGEHAVQDHYFLLEAMAAVVAPIFIALGDKALPHAMSEKDIYLLTINYLNNQELEHSLLLSHKTEVLKMMQSQVAMATGTAQVSLDYCIGQVWRHCQPTIYKEFSYPTLADEVIAKVIALDEASKRYSYGPPVESIQQLIAYSEAGVLNLDFAADPTIKLVAEGWQLQHQDQEITVGTMINAVLDAPQLITVATPIIKNVLSNELIEPLHNDLGIRTDNYGYVEVPDDEHFIPLAVLGRLAKGSVIGVDAILECFGPRTRSWASQSIKIKSKK